MKPLNNTSLTGVKEYALYNTVNYKPTVTDSITDVLKKYVSIVMEYMSFISENVNIKKHPYYRYILERGFDTITNVFKILYYFTKNLELTYYHSQKAYYFYIEFIEQISDDQNIFLKLSSRESALFVYKKTIFGINDEYKKNMKVCSKDESTFFDSLDNSVRLYKCVIYYTIRNCKITNEDKTSHFTECCNKVKNYGSLLYNTKLTEEQKNGIYIFINTIMNKEITVEHFYELCEKCTKKISSKNNIYYKLERKIYDAEFTTYLHNSKQFINWFLE